MCGQIIAPGGEVDRQTQDKAVDPSLLEATYFHSSVNHCDFIGQKPFFGVFEHLLPQAFLTGVLGMDAFESPRQSQSLPIAFTHTALDPKNDGRERTIGAWVIVFARAAFQGRPPKGGDIYGNW
jgi:hypothetical protein